MKNNILAALAVTGFIIISAASYAAENSDGADKQNIQNPSENAATAQDEPYHCETDECRKARQNAGFPTPERPRPEDFRPALNHPASPYPPR